MGRMRPGEIEIIIFTIYYQNMDDIFGGEI
jgi:hypothetical protein